MSVLARRHLKKYQQLFTIGESGYFVYQNTVNFMYFSHVSILLIAAKYSTVLFLTDGWKSMGIDLVQGEGGSRTARVRPPSLSYANLL